MSTIVQPSTNHRKILPRIIFLFWLITIPGCTERQLTSPTPQMDIETRFWIRVLLLDNIKTLKLKIASSFSIINPQAQLAQAHFDREDAPITVEIINGRITIAGWSFTGREVIILPDEPYIFNMNGDDYRGKLKLVLNPEGDSFNAINLVPLEPYVASVVGTEMPDYWEPEALKAQAIAARTYCLYIKKQFGPNRDWDVRKTQANQVYRGVSAESAQTWNAVNRTQGQVLVCKRGVDTGSAKRSTQYELFPAYYSSTCGGHTENSKNVFGGDFFEPLAGVACPYCRDVAKKNFFFWQTVQFDKAYVTNRLLLRYPNLKQLGEIKNISPDKQSDYKQFSRLTRVRLTGSTGKSDVLRAEDLRLAIDPTGLKLKSTIFKISNNGDKWTFSSGRGFGHAVGMCQYGTQAMARQGKSTKRILSHYYRRSRIVNVY